MQHLNLFVFVAGHIFKMVKIVDNCNKTESIIYIYIYIQFWLWYWELIMVWKQVYIMIPFAPFYLHLKHL